MGIFARLLENLGNMFRLLFRKNVKDDPEKQLETGIIALKSKAENMKLHIARAMKDEKLLKRRLDENTKSAQEFEKKAVSAVRENDDATARAALKRHKSLSKIAEILKTEYEKQRQTVQDIKGRFQALQCEIEETESLREIIATKRQRAALKLDNNNALPDIENRNKLKGALAKLAERADTTEVFADVVQNTEKLLLDFERETAEEDDNSEDDFRAFREKHIRQ